MPTTERNHQPVDTIVVAGQSSRWMASSVRLAGMSCLAIDCFADRDLAADGTRQLETFDQVVRESLKLGESLPVWIGQGLEAVAPRLLQGCPRENRIFASQDSLGRARNARIWTDGLRAAGLNVAQCWVPGEVADPGRKLIAKASVSSGGEKVKMLQPGEPVPADCDWTQEFVEGESWSTVAIHHGNDVVIGGVFRQLIGEPELGAVSAMQSCGVIGPIDVEGECLANIRAIARTIAECCSLQGWFGVDFIRRYPDGLPIPVEINPRPTASCELIERERGCSLFPLHAKSLGVELNGAGNALHGMDFIGQSSSFEKSIGRMLHGKATLFNPFGHQLFVTPRISDLLMVNQRQGWLADVPRPDAIVYPGRPICTVFARENSHSAVRDELLERARQALSLWEN